jgi:hypothetical protein
VVDALELKPTEDFDEEAIRSNRQLLKEKVVKEIVKLCREMREQVPD